MDAFRAQLARVQELLSKLTASQKSKIKTIQDQFRKQRETLMPRPGQRNGTPPDPATMQARFNKMRAAEQKAESQINAVLAFLPRRLQDRVASGEGNAAYLSPDRWRVPGGRSQSYERDLAGRSDKRGPAP